MNCVTDEIVGQRFGKLVVQGFSHYYVKPSDGKKEKRWLCVCDCGGTTITAKRKLETGWTTSCGCERAKRGGITKHPKYHPTYSVYNMVIQRCLNSNFTSNGGYFNRIGVCDRWLGDSGFNNFIEDMGLRPSAEHSIERVDVNKDYTPENCIWTDDNSLQSFNQRIKINNKTGKTGVRYDPTRSSPWIATIRRNEIQLKKYFKSFEDAASQRDKWEIEMYGFLKDNTPRDDI